MVIVGTHVDLVHGFNKKKSALKQNIEEMLHDQFHPLFKAVHFVSCKVNNKTSIQELRNCLYQVANSIKTYLGERIIYFH